MIITCWHLQVQVHMCVYVKLCIILWLPVDGVTSDRNGEMSLGKPSTDHYDSGT